MSQHTRVALCEAKLENCLDVHSLCMMSSADTMAKQALFGIQAWLYLLWMEMLILLVRRGTRVMDPLYEKAPLWKLIFTSQNSAQHIIDAGKHIFVQGICSTLISIAISTISPTAPWNYTDFTVLMSFPDPHTASTRLFESAFVWVFGSLRNPVSSEGHQDSLESNCTPLQNSALKTIAAIIASLVETYSAKIVLNNLIVTPVTPVSNASVSL